MDTSTFHPSWWDEQQHGTTWQRVKAAIQREWESSNDNIEQDASIDGFDNVEAAISYGYAAAGQYQDEFPQWDDKLESTLAAEWQSADANLPWEDVRDDVRRGYHAARTH